MIPAGFIHDLLARVDLAEVVGRHVELKRSGASLVGLCPFHAERTPSFSVNPARQLYHCFGCGAGGDAIRFLVEHQGLSFVESVRELADGLGVAVPEEHVSAEERERRTRLRERRLSLTEVLRRAADHYREKLRESPRAIDYLKRRGLTGAVAARFGLGYAPPGWHTLAGAFANYDDPLLDEAGLVRQRDEAAGDRTARSRYDALRDRIVFPIRSVDGEVIGFGGRVLDDSKPKYLNSPETPVFSKGRELYGLYEARQAIRERGSVVVVEGYMDVVALAQHGIANAVATLGTACTAEHVHKLFRFSDAIVFAFDGDEAGRRAAGRALEAALPHASDLRSVRFLFLPREHDPDSFVRARGAAAFEAAIAAAVPLSRQLLDRAAEGANLETAEGRARLLAQARPLWSALPEGALRHALLADLAHAGRLDADTLVALWNGRSALRSESAARPRPARPTRARSAPWRSPPGAGDLALRLLLRHSQWWDRLSDEDHQLLHELGGDHGLLVSWIERAVVEQGHLPWSAIHEALRGHASFEFACRLVGPVPADEVNTPAELQQVMQRLWICRLEAEAAQAAQAGDIEALRGLRARIDSLRALADTALLTASGSGSSAPGRQSTRDGHGESADPATLLR